MPRGHRAQAVLAPPPVEAELAAVLCGTPSMSSSAPAPPGELDGVRVLRCCLSEEQAVAVKETVEALGGKIVSRCSQATHALVPKSCGLSKDQWEQLWPALEQVHRRNGKIVSVDWLQAVMEEGCSPRDDKLCIRHAPEFVQQKLVVDCASLLKRRRLRKDFAEDLEPPPILAGAKPSRVEVEHQAATKRQRGGNESVRMQEQPFDPRVADHRRKQLCGSLQETLNFLQRERPEEVEAGQIRLAVQNSLKDWALAVPASAPAAVPAKASPALAATRDSPEEVLGVAKGASLSEVRKAYRDKLRAAHPDKGGCKEAFCRIQWAYLRLSNGHGSKDSKLPVTSEEGQAALDDVRQNPEVNMLSHKALVRKLFEEDGVDLEQNIDRQKEVLQQLGLKMVDLGARNRNEQGKEMYNQCFYLSLARSYLDHDGDALCDSALFLKRTIEAEVLAVHPEWDGNQVGENLQAFSDFLFYVLGTHDTLKDFSVAIFDSVSGFVELYIGRGYAALGPDRVVEKRANLLTLCYTEGHYQALVPKTTAAARPTLKELRRSLDAVGLGNTITYV